MIFLRKRKIVNFYPYNVLLANATNVPQRLKTAFVIQGHVYRYLKKKKIIKKVNILSLISESETHILYRLITHRGKYFKPLFLEIVMIMAYR